MPCSLNSLGFKVLAAARGLDLDGNGAAVFQELGAERFRQADGVVVAAVKHDGGGFGFQIAGGQIGPDHPKDFKAQLASVKAKNVDMIYMPIYYTEGALIAVQSKQLGLNKPVVGGDGLAADSVVI